MAAWIYLFLILAAGAALIFTGDANQAISLTPPDAVYVALGLGIAALTFASLANGRDRGMLRALRDLAIWGHVIVAVMAGYNYREDLLALGARVAAEMAPPGSLSRADVQADGEKAVRIRRRSDGHFIARTDLNGFTLAMLVDTGASTVVLRPIDAQKIGIDIDKLRYTVPVQTANGTTYAAPVKLRRVAVGPIQFSEIDALVAKPGALHDSLLGMSFLNRLRSYEFSGDFLTLRI